MVENYCYPGSNVLVNKLNIKDSGKLNLAERRFSGLRMAELRRNPIKGNFDLAHLQKIHKHLFQDLYSWAGQLRTVNISKGDSLFALSQHLKPLFTTLFMMLKNEDYLRGLNINSFSEKLAYYTSEINAFHPFREGNGRSTREFIRCLAKEAGYEINYSAINKKDLINAYIASFRGDNTALERIYKDHIVDMIKKQYITELPGIQSASVSFLEKLNHVRNVSPDGEFCSIKEIKDTYKELGKKVEDGILETGDSTFKLFSEVVTDIRKMQACNQGIGKEVEISKSELKRPSMEPEM